MFQCPNCGQQLDNMGYNMCPYCGASLNFQNNANNQLEMYKMYVRERRMWRIVFVLLELASFFVALFFCWLFAKFLNTDIFERQNYLILVVWVFLAYKIYSWFRPRIM